MPVKNHADFLPKAVIAALLGSIVGGTAGVWSLRSPAASVSADAQAVSITETGIRSSPSARDEAPVLQRARTLARRPDVMGLIALRADVVRAAEHGIGSSAIKGELAELDQLLGEARLLQLRLDAEEFRKTTGAVSRPRDPQR